MLQALKLTEDTLEEIIENLDPDPRNLTWIHAVYEQSRQTGEVFYVVLNAPQEFMDVKFESSMVVRENSVISQPDEYEIVDHF